MGLLAAFAGATLAFTSLSFAADWQTTSWSMTPQQVAVATGAELISDPDKIVFGGELGAVGSYEAMGFAFKSEFYFDRAERLRAVRLMLADLSRCEDLGAVMGSIYGSPVRSDRMGASWIDASAGDRITYTASMDHPALTPECFVAYTPLGSTGARGL
ncbi:MAG: hypothetical protein Q8S03_10295 [Brevundimonas sp.]|uniref:hypothetical protein n=1 Tax=Brevundimonas sp. TaxID=1871086 RepID=UPI0027328B0A|nr:hypothetical protein [Brevundimonas sp.]MDP3405069.1 hypothetical protein [Brevundimonas sp.]